MILFVGLIVTVGCGWNGGLVAMLVVVSCLILSVGLNLAMVSVGCVGFGFGCVGSGVVVEWLWLFLVLAVEWRWGGCGDGVTWLFLVVLWLVEVVVACWKVFVVDMFYFILTNSLYYFNQISKNIDSLMLSVLWSKEVK